MTKEDLLEYIKTFLENPDSALSNNPFPCPRPLCGCSTPTCRIKELPEYKAALDALTVEIRKEMKDAFTPGKWFGQERIE